MSLSSLRPQRRRKTIRRHIQAVGPRATSFSLDFRRPGPHLTISSWMTQAYPRRAVPSGSAKTSERIQSIILLEFFRTLSSPDAQVQRAEEET